MGGGTCVQIKQKTLPGRSALGDSDPGPNLYLIALAEDQIVCYRYTKGATSAVGNDGNGSYVVFLILHLAMVLICSAPASVQEVGDFKEPKGTKQRGRKNQKCFELRDAPPGTGTPTQSKLGIYSHRSRRYQSSGCF
jgi:hypothetical protein